MSLHVCTMHPCPVCAALNGTTARRYVGEVGSGIDPADYPPCGDCTALTARIAELEAQLAAARAALAACREVAGKRAGR